MKEYEIESHRSEAQIKHIDHVAFQAGVTISSALQICMSTKFHRVVGHTGDQLWRTGCARRGDTISNETLHKATKDTYAATNKRLNENNPEILSVRSVPYYLEDTLEDDDVNTRALLGTGL